MKRFLPLFWILVLLAGVISQPVAAQEPEPQNDSAHIYMERITIGTQGYGGGDYAAISADGQFVVFESMASDLAAGHLEESLDVYVYDRYASQLERASRRSDGQPVYNESFYSSPPEISGSGQFVTFSSNAENLVANDGNAMPDVFIHDRHRGVTELISVNLSGRSGNDYSSTPAVSADGRFVVFQSWADNLVKSDTNDSVDIFIRDRQTGVTEIVSVTDNEQQGTDWHDYGFSSVAVSDDGRYVAFSYESLPVAGRPIGSEPGIYLRDRQERTTRFIATGEYPALSASGRFLVFISPAALIAEDRNGSNDVYVYDQENGSKKRISISSSGAEVAEQYMYSPPDISANGRYVVFESDASNLVEGDQNGTSDIFLRDRNTGTTVLVSQAQDGGSGSGESHHPVIADNGSAVAFTSHADNLVSGDSNEQIDVFVFNRVGFNQTPQSLFFPMMYRNAR